MRFLLRQRKETHGRLCYIIHTMISTEDSRTVPPLSPQIAMADLMAAWPQVIPLLLERHMACVGCDMARFETLDDAAKIYRQDLRKLMADLSRVIDHPNVTSHITSTEES